MLNLSAVLPGLPEVRGEAPWPGHEYVKGWGVFSLPFDSGHMLGLFVIPEGSFASYRTVWHRTPAGDWTIYVDGPSADIACPRYYGAACKGVAMARIDLTWTGPQSLHVEVDQPAVDWTLTVSSSRTLDALNAVSARLPVWTWKPKALLWARERAAQSLGMGHLRLSGPMPNGQVGTLMPRRMWYVDEARAVFDGLDLGTPTHLAQNPAIGEVPLPARGVLAMGGGMWQIADHAENRATRAACAAISQAVGKGR